MHGEDIKLNELSQHSPVAITPGEMLAPLGDVWLFWVSTTRFW